MPVGGIHMLNLTIGYATGQCAEWVMLVGLTQPRRMRRTFLRSALCMVIAALISKFSSSIVSIKSVFHTRLRSVVCGAGSKGGGDSSSTRVKVAGECEIARSWFHTKLRPGSCAPRSPARAHTRLITEHV